MIAHRVLRVTVISMLFSLLVLSPYQRPVTLAFLGDVMLGRSIAGTHSSGDWEITLSELAPVLQSADLALANLESPLMQGWQPLPGSSQLADGYILCAPAESVAALSSAGLDILSLVNNHSLDCSPDGLEESSHILQAAGLSPLLPGEPLLKDIRGIHLAFLAFDDIESALDLNLATQSVSSARRQKALVIVSIHWGMEFQPGASQRQQAIARALVDAGASLIWGHHPHILQPLAWLPTGKQESPALVVYSLGNALFDQFAPPDARRSVVLLVTISTEGVQGVKAFPIQVDLPSGRTALADEKTAQSVLRRLGEIALFSLDTAR